MNNNQAIKILFVCTGNVCRSPMAAAIFAKKAKEAGFEDVMLSDSAGTSDAHEGEPCDARAVLTCRRRDVQLAGHRARQVEASDFEKFDLILAMDWEVLTELQQRAPPPCATKFSSSCATPTTLTKRSCPIPTMV